MDIPQTRYTRAGDTYIAYQVFGSGALDLVLVPGWTSHLDMWWDSPLTAQWFRRFGRFARVILFDKRGTGLSDRGLGVPGMDERMDDIRAVMDDAGSRRAALLGVSEGGSLAALFAATYPDRCQALVMHGAFAKFSSWFPTSDDLEAFYDYVRNRWGSGRNVARFSPSMKDDRAYGDWWARRERAAASPSAALALMRMNSEIDISAILPLVQAPTLVVHRRHDAVVDVAGGRALARLISGAELFETDGRDHTPWTGDDQGLIADKIEEFLTGTKPAATHDRVLATVMFTDIVDSTRQAEALGDRRWKELRARHDQAVRRELTRFRGVEIKSLGDGFLSTFDGPARATLCALAIAEATTQLGIEVRAGLHTGEVELSEGDVYGIAVNLAARIADQASPGECLVSRTVKDLVAGAELTFTERGQPKLKGLAEAMDLYAAAL
jgi:pimeloyl-ACP methyl ester carboxylesterase